MEERRYLLALPRRWVFLLPLLALLLFLLPFLMATSLLPWVGTSDREFWFSASGAGIFVVLVLEILLLIPSPRKRKRSSPPKSRGIQSSTITIPSGLDPPLELRWTEETREGARIVEAVLPPRSQGAGSVYVKSYVPIDRTLLLRLETIATSPEEIEGPPSRRGQSFDR